MFNLWRRVAAVPIAVALLFSVAPQPAAAYEVMFNVNRWRTDSPGFGYDFYIPVCLTPNMGAPGTGGDWDLSINRHQRLNHALFSVNGLNGQGTELRYYATNTACSILRDQNRTHLAIQYDDSIGVDGRAEPTHQGGTCAWNCVKWWYVKINPNLGGGFEWYMGDSWSVPNGKADFESAILHEVGHASGLKHSDNGNSLMCVYGEHGLGSACKFLSSSTTGWYFGPGDAVRNYQLDDYDGFVNAWGVN